MSRLTATFALALICVLGLSACSSDPAERGTDSEPVTSPEAEAANDINSDDDASDPSDASGTSIPDGARAASPDFPFPVPEGWEEIEPFTEEKIGKAVAMSAIYAHPGNATDAAKTYEQLLRAAGFEAYEYPLGAATNDASLMVEGVVVGVAYKGPLDFDTDASGVARVRINLTEE